MRRYRHAVFGVPDQHSRLPQPSQARAPIRTTPTNRPCSSQVARAIHFVERSGVLGPLTTALDSDVGRPRFLSVKALLVAMMLNALEDDHRALIRKFAVTIEGLSDHRLTELGCRVDLWPNDLYKRVDDLYNRLCTVLEHGFDTNVDGTDILVDHIWFANRIGAAPIPDHILTMSSSVAIDGTDVETPARLHSGSTEIAVDGPAREGQPVTEDGKASKREERPKARVLATGPDGRNIYTLDPDARGGYRTATNRRRGGTFVGYEWHLVVLTRDVTWTNGTDAATLGAPVPGVIVNHALAPAGSSRTDAARPLLTNPRLRHPHLNDVVVDPGYSIPDPHTFFTPLRLEGIHVTFQITSHHIGQRPFDTNAIVINEHLVSDTVPKRLLSLPLPPLGATESERARYEKGWNELAKYRYSAHGTADHHGTTRHRHPIDAGRLRSPDVPASMRRPRTTPKVRLTDPDGYRKTVRATTDKLPRASKYITGTTAHRIAYYGRRQVAESANAALHGEYVDINGRYFRVFERHRINILLAFTVAGYNHDRIRAFVLAHGQDNPYANLDTPSSDGANASIDTDEPTPTHPIHVGDPPDRTRRSAR